MNANAQPIMPFERLWTVKDVSGFLQSSRSWVYQKAESGELPSLRIGGLLRFDPQAVRAYARGERAPADVVALHNRR